MDFEKMDGQKWDYLNITTSTNPHQLIIMVNQ
jgi:hypothetical protein